jgi:hypothetical protein
MIDDFLVAGGNDEAFGEIGEKSLSNNRLEIGFNSVLDTGSVDSSLSAKVSDCHSSLIHIYILIYIYIYIYMYNAF